ncbi:uncharacterized protein M6G45_002322 [Spheniscus humboldti]
MGFSVRSGFEFLVSLLCPGESTWCFETSQGLRLFLEIFPVQLAYAKMMPSGGKRLSAHDASGAWALLQPADTQTCSCTSHSAGYSPEAHRKNTGTALTLQMDDVRPCSTRRMTQVQGQSCTESPTGPRPALNALRQDAK